MKHIDAAAHTRGESQYIDDIPQPADLLFAAVFPSPAAHGKILKLDIQEALALDGIISIYLAKDIPGENQIGPIIQDETLLAENKVHFIGEPVALVVAKTPQLSQKALKKIKLEVKELPIITDPREAFAKGQVIGNSRTFALGDIANTWDKCDIVVEGRCDIAGQEHVYLETQRARAVPLEDGCFRDFYIL